MAWVAIRKRESIAAVFLLAMALSHAAMMLNVWPLLRSGFQDFTIFYTAGEMVRNGQASALYDLPAQYRAQQEFAPDVHIRRGALPYNHPPFEALLFVPFTLLGYLPAYGIWTLLNLAMLVISVVLLRKQFAEIRSLSPALVGLAAAGFFPIAIGIIQGQDAILLLLILVVGLVAVAEGRDVAAGAVLALGLFKFHLMVPLVLVLAMRRSRVLIGFVPVALALAGVSVAMIGWHGTADYVRFVLHLESSGAGGAIVPSDMPNLRGLTADIAGARPAGSAWSMLFTFACSVAVLVAALWKVKKTCGSVWHLFGLATVATILISYHALPYDLSLLFPVTLFLFATSGRTGSGGSRADILLLTLLYLTPIYVLLWLHLDQLGWFALLLIWLFWRLGRGPSATADVV